jgi:three-Cys-motif partner protein
MRRMEFGGAWTELKLDRLESYLPTYTTIFTTNPRARYFQTVYVDAFAGSGKIKFLAEPESLFDRGEEREYLKGSAIRALEVSPPFNKYIFIESDPSRCEELEQLRAAFPLKAAAIQVMNEDANEFLLRWTSETDWSKWRSVVLLDPFAMELEWPVIEALGRTGGIDLWYLFPCGAFNRLLTRTKRPPPTWAARLTRVCGTSDWEQRFYKSEKTEGLFGPLETEEKVAGFSDIAAFLRERLETAFVKVERPLWLVNSQNVPMFMLFFAASNKKGASTGNKIAKWIIERSGN